MMIRRLLNVVLKPINLKLVKAHQDQLTHQHDYGREGYAAYRATQIFHNKRKIDWVWADRTTLAFVAKYLMDHIGKPKVGLCHGTRNGFEQRELAKMLGCEVYGTEISDNATEFENTFEWDFHEQKSEWVGRFSFVYSNSLDQAFDPQKALTTWTEQLHPDGGLLLIEHTMAHSAEGASEMDPFGAHPLVMPYLIFEWGRGKFKLADILRPLQKKDNNGLDTWIFVISRI